MRALFPLEVQDISAYDQWPDRAVVTLSCTETESIIPVWMPRTQAELVAATVPGAREMSSREIFNASHGAALSLSSHPHVDVFCDIVEAYGDSIKEVVLDGFVEGQFLVQANTEGGQSFEVRASDGIMLARHVGCPLFASQHVMDNAAVRAPIEDEDMSISNVDWDEFLNPED